MLQSDEKQVSDESLQKMRRVDWRWAAAKGFFDKNTNKWNEEMGGKEAYIRQRNERTSLRCSNFVVQSDISP